MMAVESVNNGQPHCRGGSGTLRTLATTNAETPHVVSVVYSYDYGFILLRSFTHVKSRNKGQFSNDAGFSDRSHKVDEGLFLVSP
jgi:hypothetical protein